MKRTFALTVDTLRHGELSDELNEKLRELVLKCQDTDKAGSITLTLTLKPTKSGALEVIDEVKVKEPKADKGATLMFPTVEGHLQRNDPAQGELDGIRSVGGDDAPVRRAG